MARGDTPVILNHGRWIVQCPECPNAWLEAAVPKRCDNCGCPIKVFAPTDVERHAIEEVVRPRPFEHKNWIPPETVKHLQAENIEHGVDHP